MAADRYTKLLGLAEEPRPVDHYALLGLAGYAVSVRTIRRRAGEVLTQLMPHVGTEDNDQVLALIAEVGQALKVLTDPQLKAEYDRPFYQEQWPQFAALEQEVISAGHPLSLSGRRRWIESALAMGLPWEAVRWHIDKVASRHAHPAETSGPAVQLPQWSLEKADLAFRCLALGVLLADDKPPGAYQRLTAEGDRHELPPAVQEIITQWARDVPPESRRLPLGENASPEQCRRAFELVVRGALFCRVLSPDDEARLTALALASGLSGQVVQQTIERQLQRSGAVRKRGASAALKGYPAEVFPGTPTFEAQVVVSGSEPRSWRRRRLVALAVIGLIVAGLVLLILWILFPNKFGFAGRPAEPSRSESSRTGLIQNHRDYILNRAANPRDLQLARQVLGPGASAEKIKAIRELGAAGSSPWLVDALALVVRSDAQTEVRLAAVDQLGEFEYAEARSALVGAIEPGQPEKVVQRAGRLLARQRDVVAVRSMLARLTSADYSTATAAAGILTDMTQLELTSGPPQTAQERSRLARLVIRWIAEGGPPPGNIWEELPPAGDILTMSGLGTESRRMTFERHLIELGRKGNRQAWDRLVEIVPLETSKAIRSTLTEPLVAVGTPESILIQILLLGRVDAKCSGEIITNLIKRGAPPGSLSEATMLQGCLAGLFDANCCRSWFAEQFPETAARYPKALKKLTEAEIFSRAVVLFAGSANPVTQSETTFLARAAQDEDFVAASLLVVMVRRGAADARSKQFKNIISALASVPTRQAWFFLIDEMARSESLSSDMEQILLRGALKDHLTPGLRYGDKPFGRYLAWHYYMRFGLKHSDLLTDKPFLRCRSIPEAALPVLVPTKPPRILKQIAAGAERLFRQLTPAEQAVVLPHLRNRADMGDEIAAAVVKRLESKR